MNLLRGGLLPVLLSACFLGGDEPMPEIPAAEVAPARALSARLDSFYERLAGVPIDAVTTFDMPGLRDYFTGPPAFADYYASLANQVRDARLANGKADRVVVREFHFADADTAMVTIAILGHHQRRLRFWEIELSRLDTWRRLDGVWLLVPDKL